MTARLLHQPVMPLEVLEALAIHPDGIYIDGTFGRGGHSRLILERLSPKGRLIAFDQDREAVHSEEAQRLLKTFRQFEIHHCAFNALLPICRKQAIQGKVNGILVDLGVCSTHLEDAQRGFSFEKEGPLDMRMDQTQSVKAFDWINQADEENMALAFKNLGEERFSKRIAKAIIKARENAPIQTTLELASIIKKANPAWEKHKHPATRVFQAIRILINRELEILKELLSQVAEVLAFHGRLAVISFHSLEDRLVKQFLKKQPENNAHLHKMPWIKVTTHQSLHAVSKAIRPTEQEVLINPRARSAVLRVAEKIPSHEALTC